ncbi:sulfite exporter TauE/SafE family protein [Streptacidiphilus rugosus]|uniref:sulfite exporter TauE/SafE family protein n=1 Tax=Streptacidiphilus rugosus TaxID=405783 RepID=UPI00056B29A3|nr:sulfite exporter TauE/SafE family protein [Streptacidiphilus rugosus]
MSAVVLALLCGAVVGLALGALGGGGGVLAVPALVYLLGVAPQVAGTTSLAVVAATSVAALARHAGTGDVSWRTGAVFAAAGVPPAVVASVLAHRLPPSVLTSAFAAVAALAAAAMLRSVRTTHRTTRRDGAHAGPAEGTAADGSTGRAGDLRTPAAGAGLGAVTGLLGVGGGFMVVPALVSVLRLPMRRAVGTSLVVILINSAVSLTTRLATDGASLDLAVLGPFAGAAVLGAWDGKRLAARFSGAALQRAFAVLLLAVAASMLLGVLV